MIRVGQRYQNEHGAILRVLEVLPGNPPGNHVSVIREDGADGPEGPYLWWHESLTSWGSPLPQRFTFEQAKTAKGRPIAEIYITDTQHDPKTGLEPGILQTIPDGTDPAEFIAELAALPDSTILEDYFGAGCV